MPLRNVPLVTGEIYHVFNRGSNKQKIFLNDWQFKRGVECFRFYGVRSSKMRFSDFLSLSVKEKKKFWQRHGSDEEQQVEILTYCLMPNHYHFLVKQLDEDGIRNLIGKFQNSCARYFNDRYDRVGPLWQGRFKAVRVVNEEQLLHLCRYIYLNPYSGGLVNEAKFVFDYRWSGVSSEMLNLLGSEDKFRSFVLDHADYQRKLELIKKLMFD